MNARKEPHIATIKDAAQKLTGAKRRALQAHVALDSPQWECSASRSRVWLVP